MMLQYIVIAVLIQFAFHLVQIPDFAIGKSLPHHNRASCMLYVWCDTGGCSSFTNSLLHIDLPISPKGFELSFINPKDFIPLLYSPVLVCLGPLKPFDIVLLPQQWFLDRNSTIEASFTEYLPHSGCWYIFFPWHWLRCGVMFGALSLLSCKLVTLVKLSSALLVTFGLDLSHFLMTPNIIIHCSSENFYF